MASTVAQVILKFQRRYPDCTDARAQELFSDAHRRLLTRVQVRNSSRDISLVAGTHDYALDVAVFYVHSAYYYQSATSGYELTERSIDELNVMRKNWQIQRPQGNPLEYYLTTMAVSDSAQNAIGFVQIPSVTTNAGYPCVRLMTTEYADLSGSETVPSNLLTDNYYVYDMYAKWTAETDASTSEFWEAKAEKEIQIERIHVQNMQSMGTSGYFPTSAYMATRIR